MKHMANYFVYCRDLIGVQTSLKNFSWVFGRNVPGTDKASFDQCLVKLCVDVADDDAFEQECQESQQRFGNYYGNFDDNRIVFNKRIKFLGNIAYRICREGNNLNVLIGKRYLRYVRYKVMHLHPMYYILFDFATAILLENGFLPLYCSAVSFKNGNTSVMIAPPATGKSLTSLLLVDKCDASLISEDVAITDGVSVWPAPYTFSYRRYSNITLKKPMNVCQDKKTINYLFWLQPGDCKVQAIHSEDADRIQVLNDYLLGYIKSPAIDAFYYFNGCFKNTTLLELEKNIINKLLANVKAYHIFENDATLYAEAVKNHSTGEET